MESFWNKYRLPTGVGFSDGIYDCGFISVYVSSFYCCEETSMRFISMRISQSTFFEVLTGIWVNVTSGWFAILLIVPGLFGTSSIEEYFQLLIKNLPFGIVGFVIALVLTKEE